MTGEQALNALAERVASMRAMSQRAARNARDAGEAGRAERRTAEADAFTRVLGEIAELRKKP